MKADWAHGEVSMSSVSAPLVVFFSEDGKNSGTFAVSEAKKIVRMNLGVHEDIKCCGYYGAADEDHYEVSVLMDYRKVRYEQAIREVGIWWEKECGFEPAFVCGRRKEPMYSFWYSYHQEITDEEIEKGMPQSRNWDLHHYKDDGWQTDDINRGYGYCGD